MREGDSPVRLLPAVATMRDVDSLNAEEAVVTLNDTLDGEYEGLGVDEGLAASFGLTVKMTRSNDTVTLTISGNAVTERYRQVILRAMHPSSFYVMWCVYTGSSCSLLF